MLQTNQNTTEIKNVDDIKIEKFQDLKEIDFLQAISSTMPTCMDKNFPIKLITSFYNYLEKSYKPKAKRHLKDCSKKSIKRALAECASLGIMPSVSFGHAYLVPFGEECTLMIGYEGLIEILLRDANIKKIEPRVVYEGDEFVATEGTNPSIHHVRKYKENSPMTHFYAVIYYERAPCQFEVMAKYQVDKIRKCAKSDDFWRDWYDRMALKTVIRRLAKYIRKKAIYESYEKALDVDNRQYEMNKSIGGKEFNNSEEFLIETLENEK